MIRADVDPRQRGGSVRNLVRIVGVASLAVAGGVTAGTLVETQVSQSPEVSEPALIDTLKPMPTMSPEHARAQELLYFLINQHVWVNSERKPLVLLLRERNSELMVNIFPTGVNKKIGEVTEKTGLKLRYLPINDKEKEAGWDLWPQYGSVVEWTNEVTIKNRKTGVDERWAAKQIPSLGNSWGFHRLSTTQNGEAEVFVQEFKK